MTRRRVPGVTVKSHAGQLELDLDAGGVVYVENEHWVRQHIAEVATPPTVTRCGMPIALGHGEFITRRTGSKGLCEICRGETTTWR